jgi:MscS family membrane protein
VLAFVLGRLAQYLIKVKLKQWADKTDTDLDNLLIDALDGPLVVLIYLMAILSAVAILNPPGYAQHIYKGIYALTAVAVTWLLLRIIDVLMHFLTGKFLTTDRTLAGSLLPMFRITAKLFIAISAFIIIVQNLGYSVSSLLAGLGLGGLAVALAAKDTLANIFGSLNIFLDKPFVVGDWIVTGDVEGIVEDVGFRCTRIRTWKRTQVSIPNSVIVNQTIENFSRRPRQRISITIGVKYGTPPEKLERLIERMREIIMEHPHTAKDAFQVHLSQFDPSSLGIFVYFFIDSPDWELFLKARHAIFMSFLGAFQQEGVSFGIPAVDVFMGNPPEARTA